MQEVTVKKDEVLSINGKRFFVHPLLDGGCEVKEMTEQYERDLCKRILNNVYVHELHISGARLSDDNEFFQVYDLDTNKSETYSLSNLRAVIDPSKYGLEKEEGSNYFLYVDFQKNEVIMFKSAKGVLQKIPDFKRNLIDGILIK